MSNITGRTLLEEITLASIFVESVLYGLFIALYVASTTILLKRLKVSSSRNVTRKLLIVSTMMLTFGTIHVGVDLRRIFEAFIVHRNSAGGPDRFLRRLSSVTYLVKSIAYALQTLAGDTFIIYRLYLVWSGDKRVVWPIFICFIASIAVGIGVLQSVGQASPEQHVFELQQWITAFFSLTLFTNLSSTLLIAGRIWWTSYQTRRIRIGRSSITPAAIVITESGAIYSVCLIVLLSLYIRDNYAQYIALDAISQVIGIVFSLIIVRVALGISSEVVLTRELEIIRSPGDIEHERGGSNHDSSQTRVDVHGKVFSLKSLGVEATCSREFQK